MKFLLRILIVLLAAFACGWAIVRWSIDPMRCNAAVTKLTRRTNAVETIANDYERIARARRNLEELRALRCPLDVRVPMLIGTNEEYLGQYDDAVAAYRDALRVDRRPEIYVAIADARLLQGNIDEAVENYVTAAQFNPFIIENIMSDEISRRVKERIGAH